MSIWQNISEKVTRVGGPLLSMLTGKTLPEDSVVFTIAIIALGAKMAKADGSVSNAEIDAFKQVFQVKKSELANVARVFNLAKRDVAGYEAYARRIASLFEDRREVLEDVLDGLFHIAKADDVIHPAELDFLRSVAGIFGLSERFPCIMARHIQRDGNDPYVIMGVDPCVDDSELKRLYREIVKENHPDRHIAAGVPQEMVSIATDRLAAINTAYEQILKERGL